MAASAEQATSPGRIGSARIGVLTVIDEEFDEVAAVLGTHENLIGTPYYVGGLSPTNTYDLVLGQLGGRGNVKAGTATNKLIEDFRPPYILLVGVAGGVKDRDGTSIADVIVPNFIDYYEIRKLQKGKSLRRTEPHDHPGCSLLNSFAVPVARKKIWMKNLDGTKQPKGGNARPQFRSGYLIAGEKVLGDDDASLQQQLLSEFDKAVAVDMESFGVAEAVFSTRVTRHYNPQFLVIRGISDLIQPVAEGSKAKEEALGNEANNAVRQKWKPFAAPAAAVFAAAVIERVLQTFPPDEGIGAERAHA